MTFVAPLPNQTYHVHVYAAFGSTSSDDPTLWRWTDISKYCKNNSQGAYGPITCSGGRPAIAGTADPSQISIMLDNTDGRFTAQSPLLRNGSPNPYWPNVVRDTPVQVTVSWDRSVAEYEILTAFVGGWPIQPNAGVINVTVPLTSYGRLRKLRRSNQTVASALYRNITTNLNVQYDGYWPMEDAAGSQRFVGVPATVPSMAMPGTKRAAIASNSDTPGSMPLTDFSSGIKATAKIPQINNDGEFTVDHVLVVGDTPSGSGLVPLTRTWVSNGSGSFQVSLDMTNSEWQLDQIDPTGVTVASGSVSWASTINPFDGLPHMIRFKADKQSLLVDIAIIVDDVTVFSSTVGLQFGGNAVLVGMAGVATSFPLVMGHLLVVNQLPLSLTNVAAMNGFAGELATTRMTRLANSYNIPITVSPFTGGTVPQALGPQPIDTLANIFDDTADIDNALFHDAGPLGGLVYLSGTARYNAAVGMTLDYNQHQIGDNLVATYDDQNLVTSNTISRSGGSSQTITSADFTDVYSASDTVNAFVDSPQLRNIAGWRTHEGSYDAYRLPTIDINMRATPELAEEATTVELPFRISTANIPAPYPKAAFDQFAEAFVTTIDSVEWRTTYSCSPYGPWQVGVYHTSRYDAQNAATSTPMTTVQTTVTTPGTQWGTQTPYDLTIGPAGCERVTVTAVGTGLAGTRVGARLDNGGSYAASGGHWNDQTPHWATITGIALPVARHYKGPGDFTIDTDLSQMVAGGVKVCVTLRPDAVTLNPAHITGIDTLLASLKALGANINVTLNHEPFFGGISAEDYVRHIKYYGPTVRKYYPLWVCYSGPDANIANGFYPGDNYVDGVAIDAYAASGSAETQVIQAQFIADSGNKPFAVWEFNGAADLGSAVPINGDTQAQVTNHFNYLQNLFTARLAAGLPNGDLIFFSAPGGGTGGQTGTRNWLGDSTSNDGGFETTIGHWTQAGGCTIARSTLHANSGVASLQMVATGAGNMNASAFVVNAGNLASFGLPCVAGQTVMGSAWYFAPTVSRTCVAVLRFYDAAATQIASVSAGGITDTAAGFTYAQNSSVVPVGAVFAVLWLQVNSVAGAGEVHYADDPQIGIIPPTTDLTSPIQYPWDYRIPLLQSMVTALDNTSPAQSLTITRAVNGIRTTHTVGEAIHIYPLPIYAL